MHNSFAGQIRIVRGNIATEKTKSAGISVAIPSTVTIEEKKYSLVAFHCPQRNPEGDRIYNADFLANSYTCPVTLTINGKSGRFNSAEAAYEAIKWWDRHDAEGGAIRPRFEACEDGHDAFRLRCRLTGYHDTRGEAPDWDQNYMGLGRQGAMLAVAAAKFSENRLKMALLATGHAYLLGHNSFAGTEDYWSDNYDGNGQNSMGKLLMKLRFRLGGAGDPAPGISVRHFTRQVAHEVTTSASGSISNQLSGGRSL